MKSQSTDTAGNLALIVAHCAGMIDLVALPLWVGALIQYFNLDAQHAGALVSLFLVGAVVSSIFMSTRLYEIEARKLSAVCYALAAVCFGFLSQQKDYTIMAILHLAGGVATGLALSATHGVIARSINPHLKFAIAGIGLGVFAVLFYGASPKILADAGGHMIFVILGLVMLVASLICAIAFPYPERENSNINFSIAHIPKAVWFGILGVTAMALLQSTVFSFVERVGIDRKFGISLVSGVLVVLGMVNLFPSALAALLENVLKARKVLIAGPLIHAFLAFVIMSSTNFYAYAAAASVFAAVMIFTHTFAFGMMAKLEPTGRAMSATPAMLMIGAAIGPLLGGTLVKSFGYTSVGVAAIFIGCIATFFMSQLPSHDAAQVEVKDTA